jgi:hypothetical protein
VRCQAFCLVILACFNYSVLLMLSTYLLLGFFVLCLKESVFCADLVMQLWWRIQRGDGEISSFTRFVLCLVMDFSICGLLLFLEINCVPPAHFAAVSVETHAVLFLQK